MLQIIVSVIGAHVWVAFVRTKVITSETNNSESLQRTSSTSIIMSSENNQETFAQVAQEEPQVIECTFSRYDKSASYNLSQKDIGKTCRVLLGLPKEAHVKVIGIFGRYLQDISSN